jgi:hypothetical protein
LAKLNAMRAMVPERRIYGRHMRDDALIEWLAKLGARGEIHLHCVVAPNFHSGSASVAEADPVPFPMAERTARPAREAFRPPAIDDPPTFAAVVDATRQGAALIAAAIEGIPLCPI